MLFVRWVVTFYAKGKMHFRLVSLKCLLPVLKCFILSLLIIKCSMRELSSKLGLHCWYVVAACQAEPFNTFGTSFSHSANAESVSTVSELVTSAGDAARYQSC